MMTPGDSQNVLITGAAGNLGGLLSRRLADEGIDLRLMVHRTQLPAELAAFPNVEEITADLADPTTLESAVSGIDVVIHFAGVLFAPRPERFLPTTNTGWFQNLLTASLAAGVSRVILVSFPHVEGGSSIDSPATGRTDRDPASVHARTRLEQERALLAQTKGTHTEGVVLRLGMVYGRGILMVEAARWLVARRLLAVWRKPTWIHLISTEDFLRCTQAAALTPGVNGIYHVGDERPVTLQEFLDRACDKWGSARPWRLPLWAIYTAAGLCELFAAATGRPAPLTRDFITIGRESYFGDTCRTRAELLPELVYSSIESGLKTL